MTDTCSCEAGGDCECFCTAVAAYAHACSMRGIYVEWRSPQICRESIFRFWMFLFEVEIGLKYPVSKQGVRDQLHQSHRGGENQSESTALHETWCTLPVKPAFTIDMRNKNINKYFAKYKLTSLTTFLF